MRFTECPAFGKKCYNCGKNNHLSKVCRKKKVFGFGKEKASEYLMPLFIGAVNHSSSNNNNTSDEYFKTLVLQYKEIRFNIDTGSQTNILPAKTFKSLKDVQLVDTKARLTSYTGEHLLVLGKYLSWVNKTRLNSTSSIVYVT